MIKRILKVAVPNGIENGLFQLIKVALSSITALFGTIQIAANGIAQSFWSLAALMGVGMGPAFITVIRELSLDKKYISVSEEDIPMEKWQESMKQFSDDVMYVKPGV